jgi:hypothetical protein
MRESILESMRTKGECGLSHGKPGSTTVCWLEPISLPSVTSYMSWLESMLEHIVGHAVALCDPLCRIE